MIQGGSQWASSSTRPIASGMLS